MGHREIGVAVIFDADGALLLQRRDLFPHILHPGKISLFGGHREPEDATYLACTRRELREELTYDFEPEQLEHFLHLDGSDPDIPGGTIKGDVFIIRDVSHADIIVTEGSLLVIRPEDLHAHRSELMPVADFVLARLWGWTAPT
ncbi:NUDIX domain-containing protein [Bradyrhizobium sp. I71]|uniref:NUDIX domain-containing protein n=1 Tax=Bradyrhizobium sp. I71 TaxID=2590772 RepID=UPI001EF7A618|nr:NUDIX domain-containing protein [Bradyrhizobium sp. I71]ULK95975.1 NUDIX domain-containing protein [Bradyrhizobium sp. I71]